MAATPENSLSRREQQILGILHRITEGGSAEIREALSEPLTDSSVRTFLRRMEEKGVIRHRESDGRYIYRPVGSRQKNSKSALRRVLDTFFSGSVSTAVASLLEDGDRAVSQEEISRLEQIIQQTRERNAATGKSK